MTDWTSEFQGLAEMEPDMRRQLIDRSSVISLSPGATIFAPGETPNCHILVISGTVRVHRSTETGREIVLYRIQAGESCVLTTACLLAGETYGASAIAETNVKAVSIPNKTFDDMIARSAAFRHFICSAYSRRILDLMSIIEDVAFARVDVRLAQRLLDLAGNDATIRRTHNELATELGTAREVVSRQIQEFQRRGWVTASRGAVGLTDRAALQDFAQTA